MARAEFEYRRVVRWPSGVQTVTLPTGELQARDDCTLIHGLPWAAEQGVTVTLERRRVGAWEALEQRVLGAPGEVA
jgi:hypothetical protein